jgi:hypothetical protein
MTRVVMGVVMAAMVSVVPAQASVGEPDVRTWRDGDRATITLRSGALRITQMLTRSALRLEIAHDRDVLRLSGDLEGRVSVERNGQRLAFAMRTATADDHAALNTMVTPSTALQSFDALLASAWGRTAPAARLFVSAREVLRVLQGDSKDAVARMMTPPPTASATLMLARQRLSPAQCWDTYARDVTKFTYDLQSCLAQVNANWWNPLHVAWCSYEYNLKSSLAAIWLLDCYGVPV